MRIALRTGSNLNNQHRCNHRVHKPGHAHGLRQRQRQGLQQISPRTSIQSSCSCKHTEVALPQRSNFRRRCVGHLLHRTQGQDGQKAMVNVINEEEESGNPATEQDIGAFRPQQRQQQQWYVPQQNSNYRNNQNQQQKGKQNKNFYPKKQNNSNPQSTLCILQDIKPLTGRMQKVNERQ